jgi:hypothetical protein
LKNPDGVPLRLWERGAVEPELELTPDDHDGEDKYDDDRYLRLLVVLTSP